MRSAVLLAVGGLIIATGAPVTADMAVPQVALPLMKTPPTIDGKIEEAEWAGAVRNLGLVSQHDVKLCDREAIFWAGSDGRNLYIAMKSELPPGGEMLTRAVPDGDRDIIAVTRDDSVELVVHPHLGATEGDRRYFHLIVNERGALFDRSLDEGDPQNPVDMNWRVGNWQLASQRLDGWWHFEIGIPFGALGVGERDLEHPWGLRICRNWKRGHDQARWESATRAYTDVPSMPTISFRDDAPVVQVIGLRGQEKPRLEFTVMNPHERLVQAKFLLSDTWHHNPPDEKTGSLGVAPGETQTVVYEPRHGGPEGDHHTLLRVTSADEQRVFYLREFVWRLDRPAPADRWELVKEDAQAVQLQYSVYPYHRKLLARVDIKALASKDRVTGAALTFVRQGTTEPLAASDLSFEGYVAEALLDIPELDKGSYEVRVLLGGEGVPKDVHVGLYERKVFEWEHNDLGLSDLVVAPFTPIEVNGNVLATVLREHELNAAGLWAQVRSLGRPLLKGPMRWLVQAGGKELQITPGDLRVQEAKPHRAITTGGFSAGPLRARTRTEWDYDGMAKLFLTLEAAPGEKIARLSLEIPLDDAQMGFMHACGDGLRFNFAGKTPAGEGAIWDSSQANTREIVGTFYPYLWLGGGERGLAWFADSDRGWSLDDQTPTVQLERSGGVLTMRINFVTRPTELEAKREIVFGLQATPAKPMPEDPVNWRRWICRYYESPEVQPFRIMGSCPYYGCLSHDLYPLGRDFSIYEAFSKARDTGERDDEFVERWMEKYAPFIGDDADKYEFYHRHVRAGMINAANMKRSEGWLWTPYTNARGMGFHLEEWPTFQDEWIRSQYQQRATSGGVGYDIQPVLSLRDAAVWYYREMLRCFDGIYWDNIYMAANLDTVAGGAWVDEQGRTHPSMGLWDMRELIRRTAVMLNEQGRSVFPNIPHMTNTNIIPILSFATVNLDWEWQYGKRDFQDRFPWDLTVAETIGRQCGNIPMILGGGHTPRDDPAYEWMVRTRLAVCLVHEIRVWDWGPEFHYELYGKLFAFGYGDAGCRVYNYWDEGFPLQVEGCEAKGIVMVNGNRAVAIVTDYGEGGNCALTLDLKKLGLPETVKPTDFETGEALSPAGPGEVTFPLKKHDFRAVLFE